jgi:hypothetical protein
MKKLAGKKRSSLFFSDGKYNFIALTLGRNEMGAEFMAALVGGFFWVK